MLLTSILRAAMTRSLKPFVFQSPSGAFEEYDGLPQLGLYVHIPFCRSLCDFCPYCKQVYQQETARRYKDALLREIDLVCAGHPRRKAASLYFGGGSPALMAEDLEEIVAKLREHFDITGGVGIELHPNDISPALLRQCKRAGVTMVSIGIQSFEEASLKALGRSDFSYGPIREKLALVREAGFDVIDIDLIFAIPGQTEASLLSDMELAFENGATQISTYPFIDFSFSHNKRPPLPERDKKRLLRAASRHEKALGAERTSVWTFAKPSTGRYSSVTRDFFLGFGVSACTLLGGSFRLNTFSVDAYIHRLEENTLPLALSLEFTPRQRACYYLFWSFYSMDVDSGAFASMFGKPPEKLFPLVFALGRLLGLLKKGGSGFSLTLRGAYWYHVVEQSYTHAYIDKVWDLCRKDAFPKEIRLY